MRKIRKVKRGKTRQTADRYKSPIKLLNVEQTLNEQYTLEDAVMFIPLDKVNQIHIYLYRVKEKDKTYTRYLDMRIYQWYKRGDEEGKFKPTKAGFKIPLEVLPQLMNRLNRLIERYIK